MEESRLSLLSGFRLSKSEATSALGRVGGTEEELVTHDETEPTYATAAAHSKKTSITAPPWKSNPTRLLQLHKPLRKMESGERILSSTSLFAEQKSEALAVHGENII